MEGYLTQKIQFFCNNEALRCCFLRLIDNCPSPLQKNEKDVEKK